MQKLNSTRKTAENLPILLTIGQMAKISGLGEHTIRKLIREGQLQHVQVGNRRLLHEDAILEWYSRHKVEVNSDCSSL